VSEECTICHATGTLTWVDSGMDDGDGGWACADRRACNVREAAARLFPGMKLADVSFRELSRSALGATYSIGELLKAGEDQ
jgi:hypothetical protein